jgi:ATP-dependent DNA helicase RecG
VRLVTEVRQSGRALSLDLLLVLNALWLERWVDTTPVAALIQKSEADARHVLNGLVEAQGAGSRRSYLFSARTYEKLGTRAAYVRQRGSNALRQEVMIVE